jgi:phospholipase/carboxylesterase
MSILNFVSYLPKNNKKPKHIVMLFHGYGSNSKDLISLATDLADYIEDAIFISPDAPFKFEGLAADAYQWYSLENRSNQAIMAGYTKVKPILHEFVKEQLAEHSLAFDKLILMGFSQGGMLTLYYGSQSEQQLKGMISFSGYILDDKEFDLGVRSKPKTLITHGDLDIVVPFKTYHYAFAKLETLGFPVTGYEAHGLGHGIDYGCLKAAQNFLKNL